MPELQGESFASCLDRHAGFDVSLKTFGLARSYRHLFDGESGRGYSDLFSKPWEEVVREGSTYFPEGRLALTITVRKLTKDDKERALAIDVERLIELRGEKERERKERKSKGGMKGNGGVEKFAEKRSNRRERERAKKQRKEGCV